MLLDGPLQPDYLADASRFLSALPAALTADVDVTPRGLVVLMRALLGISERLHGPKVPPHHPHLCLV